MWSMCGVQHCHNKHQYAPVLEKEVYFPGKSKIFQHFVTFPCYNKCQIPFQLPEFPAKYQNFQAKSFPGSRLMVYIPYWETTE